MQLFIMEVKESIAGAEKRRYNVKYAKHFLESVAKL